jgi:uncharacterized protein (DUF885 family)
MAKIRAEMDAVIRQTGFQGDLPAFLHFLRTDPRFYPKTAEELLMRAAWIAKKFDGKADQYFGYLPRRRFAIKPGAGRPGAVLHRRPRRSGRVSRQHLQPAGARAVQPARADAARIRARATRSRCRSRWSRKACRSFRRAYISAFGEGWALYCERLGTEMGMYETPYETFGMLSYQAWRASRLVVDTGVHAQGLDARAGAGLPAREHGAVRS